MNSIAAGSTQKKGNTFSQIDLNDLTIDATSVDETRRDQADGDSFVFEQSEQNHVVQEDVFLALQAEVKTSDDDLQHMMLVSQKRSATIYKYMTQARSKVVQLVKENSELSTSKKQLEATNAKLVKDARREIRKAKAETTNAAGALVMSRKEVQQLAIENGALKSQLKEEKLRADKAKAEKEQLEIQLQSEKRELVSARKQISDFTEREKRSLQENQKLDKFMTPFLQNMRERDKVYSHKALDSVETKQEVLAPLQMHERPRSVPSQQTESLWEKRVRPHFDRVITLLSPKKILSKLFSKKLITRSEYNRLGGKQSDDEIAEELLRDILLKKGNDAFHQFCEILRDTEGQEEIAHLIDPSSLIKKN